jgi:phage baseplate assembly protein W
MAQAAANEVLGRDLGVIYRVTDGRHEDVDLTTARRIVRRDRFLDLVVEAGVANAVQAVVHRIKTMRGELADLGHPDYGSRHHELIGQPNSENNRNLVKLFVLQALADEPRIERIHRAAVEFDRRRAPDTVTIVLDLSFIDSQVGANLVVPFSFGGGL